MGDFSRKTENKFYKDARIYWANVAPTVDGVLGGYGFISNTDIEGSKEFLNRIFSFANPPGKSYALDCGAGIGRISQNLLMEHFDKIDLVEQDEKFLSAAKDSIGSSSKMGEMFKSSLQKFKPKRKYDLIWCQWVLGYLNDYDTMYFLDRCGKALAPNGIVVVKENITTGQDLEYDEDDSSVTRPMVLMQKLFDAARLQVVLSDVQRGFPDEIYAVHMFALVPLQSLMSQINETDGN